MREVQIAAALDPRIKLELAAFGMDQCIIENLLVEEFNTEYRTRFAVAQVPTGTNPSAQDTGSSLPLLRSLMRGRASTSRAPAAGESFRSELHRWFTDDGMDLEKSSRDVCTWFQVNGSKYPRVQMIARDYLRVTATSVPSEQAFSKAGCTIRDNRARLGDDAVRAICELQSFLAFNKS